MKIVQSLWLKPGQLGGGTGYADIHKCGWASKKYHYLGWTLSSLLIREHYDELELVTDSVGHELLIDKMRLPYTKVSVVLDELNNYHRDLFALAKIYAYELQKEPFIHVDSDVFIWQKFGRELEEAELVCQSPEEGALYADCMGPIKKHFDYYPAVLDQSIARNSGIRSINAGIIGGNDISFFQNYCRTAFEFINRNTHHLDKIKVRPSNLVFEQFLFKAMAEDQRKKIRFYSEGEPVHKFIAKLTDLTGIPDRISYVHLYAGHKKVDYFVDCLEYIMLRDFPEHYYRILNLIRTNQI